MHHSILVDVVGSSSDDPALQRTLEIIDKYGWEVRHVGLGKRLNEPCFTYSIGLTAMNHPEIVIPGLPPRSAQLYINWIGNEVRGGRQYLSGTSTGEFFDSGALVCFITADDTSWLTGVKQIYGSVRALQLIWPDSGSRLPWEEGYENPLTAQPLLGKLPLTWSMVDPL